jgi:hypothetical protein
MLRELIAEIPARPSPTGLDATAEDLLRRRHCFGCHARDGEGGGTLGAQLAALLSIDSSLASLKGTLTPPNLSAVGDKLRGEYLAVAVRAKAPTARPWLSVRMPSFAFEPGEAEAIIHYLQRRDRMAEREDSEADSPAPIPPTPPAVAATAETAARLLGQQGFGCVSCHVVAGRIPPGGEPETLGPDLALAHQRMTPRYFRRWLDNPQRIIAGTPMPQFVKPAVGVAGTLDDQLEMVWNLLGSRRAVEAATSGTRKFLERQGDRPLVVFDMVLVPEAPATPYTPRGLAIGLKNDHSLLLDADRLTWLAWWRGGFLSRTKNGRLWEWHPEGERLWTAPARLAPLVFIAADARPQLPTEERERFGHFDAIDFEGSSVTISYSLRVPGGSAVKVAEKIRPIEGGWERLVTASGVPRELRAALVEMPPKGESSRDSSRVSWTLGKTRATLQIEGASPARMRLSAEPRARLFLLERGTDGTDSARVRLSVAGQDRPNSVP